MPGSRVLELYGELAVLGEYQRVPGGSVQLQRRRRVQRLDAVLRCFRLRGLHQHVAVRITRRVYPTRVQWRNVPGDEQLPRGLRLLQWRYLRAVREQFRLFAARRMHAGRMQRRDVSHGEQLQWRLRVLQRRYLFAVHEQQRMLGA